MKTPFWNPVRLLTAYVALFLLIAFCWMNVADPGGGASFEMVARAFDGLVSSLPAAAALALLVRWSWTKTHRLDAFLLLAVSLLPLLLIRINR